MAGKKDDKNTIEKAGKAIGGNPLWHVKNKKGSK